MSENFSVFAYINSKEQFTNTGLIDFSVLNPSMSVYADSEVAVEFYSTPFIAHDKESSSLYSIKLEVNKKSNEVKTKYEELSASKYTDIDNDYNSGVLVELKKCFNNKVRIDDDILLKTILNKLESAILNDVSKPMNTAVVNNMINKSIETQEKQREIDEIKQQLKKAEKEKLETNLTSLSIQNDLFLK